MIYHFHSETKEYVGESNPINFPGTSDPIVPANATTVAPPSTVDNQAAIFDAGSWSVVPDWRSTTFYDTTTQEEVSVPLGSDPPSGLTSTVPSPGYIWSGTDWVQDIEYIRNLKIAEISGIFLATNDIGVDCTTSTGVITMDGGQVHAQTFKSGYDLAVLNSETTMDIVDFFDVVHPSVTLADAELIMKQQGNSARDNWSQKVLLKRQILDATTISEVEAISWT